MQAALPLGPYDPADPMVHAVVAADRDAVWSPQQVSLGEPVQVLQILEQSPAILCGQLQSSCPFEKAGLACLGPQQNA